MDSWQPAEEEATVDTFFVDPVVHALIEMVALLVATRPERRWSKEKFSANKIAAGRPPTRCRRW
jgi:hypothetical protein